MWLKIQAKFSAVLVGIGVFSALATAAVSIYVLRKSLIENAFEHLTSIRRSKSFQIESYFKTVNRHVLTLSESFMVSQGLDELGGAYERFNQSSMDEKKREEVLQYYDRSFLPELKKYVDLRINLAAYAPKMPSAVRLQWHYILQNPHPAGQKSKLDVATEHAGGSLCEYCAAHKKFHSSFRRVVERFGYVDLMLVDQQGHIVYTVLKEPDFGTSLTVGPFSNTKMASAVRRCLESGKAGDVFLSDFEEYEPSMGAPSAFVCSPIFNPLSRKRSGALVLQLSNKEVERVVSGDRGWLRDGLGKTGDSGVVGDDYLIRSNVRLFQENPEAHLESMRKRGESEKQIMRVRAYATTALLLQVKLPSVEKALRGETGTMVQKGRSGRSSMVSYAPLEIPGVKWTIATRMDEDEILAPMNTLIRDLLLLILGVIAVTAVFSRIAAKSLATPIRSLAAAAAAIAGGNLSARADVRRKDEVGELGESFNAMAKSIEAKTALIEEKNRENEALLLNILPQPIADRLKSGEGTIADHFAEVTVLFADIVGFTVLSSKIPPGEVVDFLNNLFTRFDALAIKLGVEKIKTIGDAYMAVAGIPNPSEDHATRVAELALGIVEETRKYGEERGMEVSIRVGLNSGPVVAGVIGSSKFIYDLWGDTVNVASRMESHGEAGRVQVTRPVFEALNGKYRFEPRGTIQVKGKGEIETWLMLR
jgi:class 3 adenylate cyclase